MLPEKLRRISAVLAALALVAGLVTNGFDGPDMVPISAMAAVGDMSMSPDMPMPGKCNGCPADNKCVAPGACSAYCGTVIAFLAVAVIFGALPAGTLGPFAGRTVNGHADPPDPYPPRPIIIS